MVSGFKKKKKEKLVIAKDPKQLKTAIIVVAIFILNGIYTGIKVYMENNPPATANNTVQTSPSNTEGVQQETIAKDANNIYQQTIGKENQNENVQVNAASNSPISVMSNEGDVDIIERTAERRNKKMATIVVANSGRNDPFMPDSGIPVARVSSGHLPPKLPFLSIPPETLPLDSDAGKVMTTTISGILYDKYSPSAIINIEGTDYLVKVGDIINRYKILLIDKSQVIVQLGRNIYKAGVGELLSPTDLNYNIIANLNRKFGGNSIPVNVKKKVKK